MSGGVGGGLVDQLFPIEQGDENVAWRHWQTRDRVSGWLKEVGHGYIDVDELMAFMHERCRRCNHSNPVELVAVIRGKASVWCMCQSCLWSWEQCRGEGGCEACPIEVENILYLANIGCWW